MLYNMPQKVKVSGSRPLRKGSRKNSRKNSKKGTKKHAGIDFTSILNDMTNNQAIPPQMPQQGNNMMQNPMMQNPMMQQQMGNMMQNPMMQNPMGNMMPNAFGNMMGDMSNMMMGNNSGEVDPLHIQQLIPQGQNLNINNYGISVDQLNSGEQNTGLSNRFNGMGARQMRQTMPPPEMQQMTPPPPMEPAPMEQTMPQQQGGYYRNYNKYSF
jgi:hypothetical protein